jgi:hypothetical protein
VEVCERVATDVIPALQAPPVQRALKRVTASRPPVRKGARAAGGSRQ